MKTFVIILSLFRIIKRHGFSYPNCCLNSLSAYVYRWSYGSIVL